MTHFFLNRVALRTAEIVLDMYLRWNGDRLVEYLRGFCHAFRSAVAATVLGWAGPSRFSWS